MDIGKDKAKCLRLLPATVLVVCLFGGVVWFWQGVAKDRLIPKRWSVVEGHRIYRSGQLSASLVRRVLARHGIQVIVALTFDDPRDQDQAAEEKAAADLGIELLHFPLFGDGTGDVNNYAGAVAAVIRAERQGRSVLVHCAAGAQRTGGVIAFYELLVDKKPPAVVLQELRHHGWNPKSHPNLVPYLNANLGPVAAFLHEQGLLDAIPDPLPVLPTDN
jgi:protein tyrosine/serine phosphatase